MRRYVIQINSYFVRVCSSANMNTQKKLGKKPLRKVVAGIKLPPIEPVEDDVKTIVDIDPDFFKLVEGRPVRPNTSFKKYKEDIKELSIKRILHSFVADEIIRLEREIENERSIYETAYKHFEECQHSFDKFLAFDNDKTIVVMKKSDAMAKDLANLTEAHKKVNYEMASLRSKIQYIDESLLILLSFENFLHKAAPILWQESNKVILDEKHSEIVPFDSDIFQTLDVALVKERLNKLAQPRLFFETPEQLLTIFELLEKQNLNYLLATEELNAQKNKFVKTKDHLRSLLRHELDYIQKKVDEIEEYIKWNEMRESEIKEIFHKILEDKIKSLVSSDMVLQIFNYVEFAYEQLITPNDTNIGSLEMTLALEREYDNLLLKLTEFDLDLVKEIEKETYQSTQKEIKQAKESHKLLKDVDKLNKRLKSSYEPSRRKSNE